MTDKWDQKAVGVLIGQNLKESIGSAQFRLRAEIAAALRAAFNEGIEAAAIRVEAMRLDELEFMAGNWIRALKEQTP